MDELVRLGISCGSTIVGLEHHMPQNVQDDIDYAVSHGTDLLQFMLYTPVLGIPLYQQMTEQGRMPDDVELADIGGRNPRAAT
jgi:hypothetical protein